MHKDIWYLLDACYARLLFDEPQFLDNAQAFYALHQELQGDMSRLSNTKAARAIYGSYEALEFVIRLRQLWLCKHQRGAISEEGKVIRVNFGLSPEEDKFLSKGLEEISRLLRR